MYIPTHFRVTSPALLNWLFNHDSFVTLVSTRDGVPFASHLPIVPKWDGEQLTLEGHWARENSQWQGIESQTVLSIVHGPHSYISPTWYADGQRRVPTWNYAVAHLYGKISLIESAEELSRMLGELVARYEKPDGWSIDTTTYNVAGGMRGIVGFKLIVEKIEMKAKLNQNHPVENVRRVIEELRKIDSDDTRGIADLMQRDPRLLSET